MFMILKSFQLKDKNVSKNFTGNKKIIYYNI